VKYAYCLVHAECPTGFTYIASVNGCYTVVRRSMTWTRAGRECQSQHSRAHLLVINDAQEQLAVATISQFTFLVLFIVSLTPDWPELGKPRCWDFLLSKLI